MSLSIAVFAGSRSGTNPDFSTQAARLGELLAQRKFTSYFGGGQTGLMRVFTDAAVCAHGRIKAIIPPEFSADASRLDAAIQVIPVDSVPDRKRYFNTHSQAVFALPGGIGSLDELLEVMAYNDTNKYCAPRKPVVPVILVNTGNYFRGLQLQLDDAVHQGFVDPQALTMLHVAATADDAVSCLNRLRSQPYMKAGDLKQPPASPHHS